MSPVKTFYGEAYKSEVVQEYTVKRQDILNWW